MQTFGALAVVAEPGRNGVGTALVLDDRDSVHATAWRLWLQLSNALALRDWPTVITTTSRMGAPTVPLPAGTEGLLKGMDTTWVSAYESAAPGTERAIIRALARDGRLEVPVSGTRARRASHWTSRGRI